MMKVELVEKLFDEMILLKNFTMIFLQMTLWVCNKKYIEYLINGEVFKIGLWVFTIIRAYKNAKLKFHSLSNFLLLSNFYS